MTDIRARIATAVSRVTDWPVDITDEDREQIATFGQLVAYVERKAKAEAMTS